MTVLVHLSDFHLTPVPLPLTAGLKPVLGWINWARKPGAHRMDALARVLDHSRAQQPALVAVTGDLSELSTAGEIKAGIEALRSCGPPDRTAFAPGNHDSYTSRAPGALSEAFEPWLGDRSGDTDALRARFPVVRVSGGVALVTLCSGVPTWLFSAEGELGRDQLERLDALLRQLDDSLACVMAVHHPPVVPGLAPLKRLRDGEALMQLAAKHRVGLVLHGHLHEPRVAVEYRGGRAIVQMGAPSASSARDAGYWRFDFDGGRTDGWQAQLFDSHGAVRRLVSSQALLGDP